MVLSVTLLVLYLIGLFWFLRRDLAEYAAFKQLTATADRQRRYRAWILKSFLLFLCGSLACLALLGRLHDLLLMPSEFRGLSENLRAALPGTSSGGGQVPWHFIVGVLIGGSIGALAMATALRRVKPRPVGDIAALLPRNAAETAWMALMSLNAGVAEECFFRLLLPLLLARISGSALFSFLAASAIFGLVHLYQRWPGILATGLIGLVLSAVYLWTASLWVPVILHATIDLMGVVVRPTLQRRMRPAI